VTGCRVLTFFRPVEGVKLPAIADRMSFEASLLTEPSSWMGAASHRQIATQRQDRRQAKDQSDDIQGRTPRHFLMDR